MECIVVSVRSITGASSCRRTTWRSPSTGAAGSPRSAWHRRGGRSGGRRRRRGAPGWSETKKSCFCVSSDHSQAAQKAASTYGMFQWTVQQTACVWDYHQCSCIFKKVKLCFSWSSLVCFVKGSIVHIFNLIFVSISLQDVSRSVRQGFF